MNEAQTLYLATYGFINNIDKLMVVVVAYDMYCEVAKGKLNPSWKIQKPMSFWQFCNRLGIQMLYYDPKYCIYPGDERMRPHTALNKVQRKKSQDKSPDNTPSSSSKKRS